MEAVIVTALVSGSCGLALGALLLLFSCWPNCASEEVHHVEDRDREPR